MLGLRSEKNVDSLNISHYSVGDDQIKALSSIFKTNKRLSGFQFKNNRITSLGADALIRNLNFNIITLDLSKNKIGLEGSSRLSAYLA